MSIIEQELEKQGVFEGNLPSIITDIANSIPSNTIPYRMKLAIAVSEVIRFTSQFRKNILHWNGSSIPVNAITFCIAKSGASKDSSVSACRKCFEGGYEILQKKREEFVKKKAQELALDDGHDEDYLDFSVYKDYIIPAPPFVIGVSTIEGLLQNLADSYKLGIGSGFLYTGECGAELSSNTNFVDNIKAIAELYDEGNKEVKALKDKANMTELKNMPMSAMIMGSQDNLLYDDIIKNKFKNEFNTKMGRRSFFIFVKEDMPKDEFHSVQECLTKGREREDKAKAYKDSVFDTITSISDKLSKVVNEPIKVSDEVRNLYILYTRYNEELAYNIAALYPIAKLSRTHMQWKAFKTAGAFALMDCSDTIELKHFKAAIEYTELVSSDISEFEKELVKEPYEVFADYVKEICIEDKAEISLHTLRKLGYIPTKGNPMSKLKDLVQLVTSYDKDGIYTTTEDGIKYSKLVKSDLIGVSWKRVKGTKEERNRQTADGFFYKTFEFKLLYRALINDTIYCPFSFLNGKRNKDNINSGCKWLVFDVDNSTVTDTEMHEQLKGINHFIARTKNKDNPNKFRVLIELDSIIDLDNSQWKPFISTVAEELGIEADILPKSQIYYGYATSKDSLLSETDSMPLETKPLLDIALSKTKAFTDMSITKSKASSLLNNPEETFYKAYNAKDGEGSRKLIWAAKYAKELGATKEYIIKLINDINDNWYISMDDERLNTTILSQINRWNFD